MSGAAVAGNRPAKALLGLRIVVSCLLFVHGSTRLVTGGVPGFSEFFSTHHLPGVGAWIITIMEIVGTLLLARGIWARPLALYFAAELMMGIILVHAQHGWFVVGGGANGVEYSLLLISVFIAVAFASDASPQRADGTAQTLQN